MIRAYAYALQFDTILVRIALQFHLSLGKGPERPETFSMITPRAQLDKGALHA